MARILTLFCEETGEEIALPTRWEICGSCRGEGRSSLYLGAITESDREPGGCWEDPEDFDRYVRGGYDRTCDECGGSGKVRVVDHEKLTRAQRRELRATIEAEREMAALERAERRASC